MRRDRTIGTRDGASPVRCQSGGGRHPTAARFRRFLCHGLAGIVLAANSAHAAPIPIVAAENFWGDIARQIGGDHVEVATILSNPAQDPHEFEANAAAARAIADAALVVYSGAGYDPWVDRLLAASPSPSRKTVAAATIVGRKTGDNPHFWYAPAAAPAVAAALAGEFARLDPAHAADYATGLARFSATLAPLHAQIAALRRKYAGTPVTATEPVFDDMAQALGLAMRNRGFQLAVMNGTEPSPSAVAAIESDLRRHAVKALLYNAQTTDALTARLREIAARAGIPVVGVTETEPPGSDYQQWMGTQLDALDRALRP